MNDKTQATRDPFEFGEEPMEVTITIRGKSKKYLLHEISKKEFDVLYAPSMAAKTDEEKKVANNELVNRAISSVASRLDGTRFDPEEVSNMRAALVAKLGAKCVAFFNGTDVESAGEDMPATEEETEKKG